MSESARFEPRRELARTGFRATRIGAGDLADRSLPLESCVHTLRRALDADLNLVDTALLGLSFPNEQDRPSKEKVPVGGIQPRNGR